MARIEWEVDDPLIDEVELSQDEQGLWMVKVSVREQKAESLGQKVVRARMVDQGRFFGKEIASETWPVAQTRKRKGMVSRRTLVFRTGTNEYPDNTKIEFEFVHQK